MEITGPKNREFSLKLSSKLSSKRPVQSPAAQHRTIRHPTVGKSVFVCIVRAQKPEVLLTWLELNKEPRLTVEPQELLTSPDLGSEVCTPWSAVHLPDLD